MREVLEDVVFGVLLGLSFTVPLWLPLLGGG